MKQNFKFLKNTLSGKWVILAPKRAKRPDIASGKEPTCPFCEGREALTPKEVFRVGKGEENKPGWQIRIVPNKFPFAPIHELIIHSPIHKDSFFTYKPSYIAKIFQVYKERYNHYEREGQVLIFYNHGVAGGESLPHSHSQVVVIPDQVPLDAPRAASPENIIHESHYFVIFIPLASGWPYEVWFLPKVRGQLFGEIDSQEIGELSIVFSRVLRKTEKILGVNFPFNFYIYPAKDWYLRLIPRLKVLGGLELATGIFVNTTDPVTAAKKLAW
jgi:UDPglucose--hexose-1-phosphate uridylyltransferase